MSSQKDVTESLQLSIYALACRDSLGLGTPERVTLYFTEAATRKSTTRSDEQLDLARAGPRGSGGADPVGRLRSRSGAEQVLALRLRADLSGQGEVTMDPIGPVPGTDVGPYSEVGA